jgi:hypothetical protein
MSFQAYIDNIKEKTGNTPDDFKQLAEAKGFMDSGQLVKTVKATQITDWLKEEFGLELLVNLDSEGAAVLKLKTSFKARLGLEGVMFALAL